MSKVIQRLGRAVSSRRDQRLSVPSGGRPSLPQGIENLREAHRLGEIGREAEVFYTGGVAPAAKGTQHDQYGVSQHGVSLYSAGEGLAIHFRHGLVQDGDVKRVAFSGCCMQCFESVFARVALGATQLRMIELFPKDEAVSGIVIHVQ